MVTLAGIEDEAAVPAGHIVIEHPSGTIAVSIETRPNGDHIGVVKAGAVRTARLIMRGEVLVLPRPL
jgi:2-methylaconitate cis-trans-isomerase PrpF